MENFLIIRLSSLGDIIHTLPAFSALRKNFPKAHISWIAEKKGKELLDFVPGIDGIIVTHEKGWRKKIRERKRIALDFQGLVKSGFIASLSGARKRIGFHHKNLKEPLASLFYTERLEELPDGIHIISKNLKLLEKLGIREEKYEFPLQLPDKILNEVREKLKKIGYEKKKKLIIYNVGAAWETKRWFPEKWIMLIQRMEREEHFPLLLWGNEEERRLADKVREKTSVPLAPFFSVKEVMALIKESSLLVSGDTFALQAACAFSLPVIGIFGPTNPLRNGPFNPRDKVAFARLNCAPCYKRTCPTGLKCLERISAEEMAEMALEELEKNG